VFIEAKLNVVGAVFYYTPQKSLRRPEQETMVSDLSAVCHTTPETEYV
jgi:hypothetical protein